MQVSTVPTTTIAAGFTQIITSKRETKETGKLEAHQRSRSIIIPELIVTDVPSKFQKFIISALYDLARAQLAALWEQDAQLKEVSDNIWGVDALLLFYSREQESKRLTKTSVEAWFKASKLAAFLTEKKDEKLLANWSTRILSLSAPVIDLNEKQCTVTIATIGKFEEDAESIIGQQLVTKLQRRIDAIKAAQSAVSELEEI